MTEVPVLIWITCHNYENYLPEALMSAHCQTVRCPVMVEHDACGKDHPVGLSASRNVALKASASVLAKYVVFLDADDKLQPNYIEELYTVASGAKCVVTSPAELWGEQTGVITPVSPVTVDNLLPGNTIHCSAMIHLSLLDLWGGYDETLSAWEDWELWTRLASKCVPFKFTDKSRLLYRRHSDSMNFMYQNTQDAMREKLRQLYG